ncbi:MAG: TnsA endonuclease N-terminal domain-containing protein [Thermoplasmata archaeon]|nr:TnsA endonuclease N-terminal domain-containing protein [Thermoplasmata archaeon]
MSISKAKRYQSKRRRSSGSRFKRGFYAPLNEEKYQQPTDRTMNKGILPEYRSSYELKFMKWCDMNPEVEYWGVEPFPIPYVKPTDNQVHRYFPDAIVKFKNGKNFLIEIKPKNQCQDPVNLAKWDAAKKFCEGKDIDFIVMTEKELGIK